MICALTSSFKHLAWAAIWSVEVEGISDGSARPRVQLFGMPGADGNGRKSPKSDILLTSKVPVRFQFPLIFDAKTLVQVTLTFRKRRSHVQAKLKSAPASVSSSSGVRGSVVNGSPCINISMTLKR